jgi:hypothetical protein
VAAGDRAGGPGARAAVAAAELDALDAAIARMEALAAARLASVGRERGALCSWQQGQEEPPATLAAMMARLASADALFLDEVRFSAWQAGLVPLARVLRRLAAAVEALRAAMPA